MRMRLANCGYVTLIEIHLAMAVSKGIPASGIRVAVSPPGSAKATAQTRRDAYSLIAVLHRQRLLIAGEDATRPQHFRRCSCRAKKVVQELGLSKARFQGISECSPDHGRSRSFSAIPPSGYCDALSRDAPKLTNGVQTLLANCVAHGRRQFVVGVFHHHRDPACRRPVPCRDRRPDSQ